ncbi:MAG: hypothetical protein IT366_02235 [Candidatus Hydrogenedentes bacterium]|nr:hypothetical protein [Candidatus Hydrogenedentota bacterium]
MKKNAKMSVQKRAAKVVLRVIELEKKAFDGVAKRLGSIQARADKIVLKRVDAAKWMPKEGKQLVSEWVQTMKKGRADLRKAVDTSFDLSTDFVKRVSEPAAKESKKKAPVVRRKAVHQPAAA